MFHFIALFILAVTGPQITPVSSHATAMQDASVSRTTTPPRTSATNAVSAVRRESANRLCNALAQFPRSETDKLNFEKNEVGSLCKPYMQRTRASLDMCGDGNSDPYTSAFTWASREQMAKQGKINIVSDPKAQPLYTALLSRAEEIRHETANICCGADLKCQEALARVEVQVCKPSENNLAPDPCVFGGYYEMQSSGYDAIYSHLYRQYGDQSEIRKIAEKNLDRDDINQINRDTAVGKYTAQPFPQPGHIVLSSYVSAKDGVPSLEPTLRHEFGHACSMVKMQLAADSGKTPESMDRAVRAARWLNQVKTRCDANGTLPEAYNDFWQSVGETHEFAQCIYKLTTFNQQQKIDRPCPQLCPGHYMEEAVGITFSLLTGDLSGVAGSVFPNTCNHVRDGQHPMVADVMECLTQYSPRFRERLSQTYVCHL